MATAWVDAPRLFVFGVAFCVGVIAWMTWLAGIGPTSTGAFALTGVMTASLLGFFFAAPWVGLAFVLGPMLLIAPTASWGDGAFVIFWYPTVLFLGILFWVAGIVAARLATSWQPNGSFHPSVVPQGWLTATLAVLAVLSIAVTYERWPDTAKSLDAALATFPVPAGFVASRTQHSGNPLCTRACSARVSQEITGPSSSDDVCALAVKLMTEWTGREPSRTGCVATGNLERGPTGWMVAKIAGETISPTGPSSVAYSFTVKLEISTKPQFPT